MKDAHTMSDPISLINQDSYPRQVKQDFVKWLIFAQARPALVQILQKTGMNDEADALARVGNLRALHALSERAGQQAHAARKKTGPLGISTAEAASFIMSRMAESAYTPDCDAEEIAFFAVQICGWLGFAQSGFSNPRRKAEREIQAQAAQEQKLETLYTAYLRNEDETKPPSNRARR